MSRFFIFLLTLACPFVVLAAGSPPAAPGNLQGDIDGSTVELTWDIPSDPDDTVEGYNVYRDNRYLTTVFDNQYIGEVEPDTLYTFSVVAFDERPRTFSSTSDSLTLPQNLVPGDLTVPPTAPENLSGIIDGTRVELSWTPSTDDEAVLGYNVYRNNAYLSTVFETAYVGEVVEGESYNWYIVAFDIRRNFSTRSDSLNLPATGPVDTTIAPSVPTALTGSVSSGAATDIVELTWNASSDDQAVAGYNVYRNSRYLSTVFTTAYSGKVDSGSSNIFQITAFDFDSNFSTLSEPLVLPEGSGESDPGEPPSIPTGLTGTTSTNDGQTQVELTWSPSTGPVQVAGYNVYRDNRYLTTVRVTQFTDTIDAGESVSYAIAAFDNFDNFSPLSRPFTTSGEANRPPFFQAFDNQFASVGEQWSLRLAPIDLDGGAAGILVEGRPAGMSLVDNLDGTQSLQWTPSTTDVGVYEITAIAFDLQDTSLRTSETFTLTVAEDRSGPLASFSISIDQIAYELVEGDTEGLRIPVRVQRDANSEALPLELTLNPRNSTDSSRLTARFEPAVLDEESELSTLTLILDIDTLPILAEQRRFDIVASDGLVTDSAALSVAVTPVARDDVYLLIGQSNMVGASESNARMTGPGEADAADLRIFQANVSRNDSQGLADLDRFLSVEGNFEDPMFITAVDPLHNPTDPVTLVKSGSTIGLGLSFAKHQLQSTTRSVMLVPAAWSGSGFCVNADVNAHWNANPSENPSLGNTLMFDRALARINTTLAETGGILRGILWHQGENDSNSICAQFYAENLQLLVDGFRQRIVEDARGSAARGLSSDVPFVVGTMSQGIDERGDFSLTNPHKQIVDSVHRNVASLIPYSEVSIHDDLVPANGFPCGQGSCIHFGAAALREMGWRYHQALQRAVENATAQ